MTYYGLGQHATLRSGKEIIEQNPPLRGVYVGRRGNGNLFLEIFLVQTESSGELDIYTQMGSITAKTWDGIALIFTSFFSFSKYFP